MGYDTIEYLRDGAIGIIKLNRQGRMNAVIEKMATVHRGQWSGNRKRI